MFIIKSPVENYEGNGYGLCFKKGEATTDDERVAMLLEKKGYIVTSNNVETVPKEVVPQTVPKTATKNKN